MSEAFLIEVTRQRRRAQRQLRRALQRGDDYLVDVARTRLDELHYLTQRIHPTT
jgi:hypothetical protein